MKRFLYLASLAMALVVMITPNTEATVGTVHNGALNDADVNRDGNITAVDVTALYDYLLGAGNVSDTFNYDVNGDGSVNVADITMVYGVMLNWQPYNSIFDAFNLSFTNFLNREYYKFSWDDVATLGYEVTNPDYMLVIGTDENFTKYNCWHFNETSTTIGKQTISEWLKSEYNWTSPSDVPNTIDLYARVEVKLDNGSDVIISNERNFLHLPQFTFESSQPIHLWWLTGSFIGVEPWSNDGQPYGSYGMVPMYPVQGATYNENGEGPLEYYGYFPAGGEFKIIEEPGRWELVMGGGNENGGQVYSGNMTGYPDNIIINQGGYYKIDLNTVSKTMTMTRLSDSQTSYSTITMPGYYQDWVVENDPMGKVSPSDNHDWHRNFELSSDSELKFAPGSWDYDWGTNAFPFGKGYQGGYNIPAKSGDYYVYFNDLSGDYMFIDPSIGLPGSNFLNITKTANDLINLTSNYSDGTKLHICNISTDLEGPFQLRFDSRSITIDQDGNVDINELKEAVFSTYDRPRTGGCNLYCWVEAQSGPQTVKSNFITISVQIENYSIVIEGSGTTIAMSPSSLKYPCIPNPIDPLVAVTSLSLKGPIMSISAFDDSGAILKRMSLPVDGITALNVFKIPYNSTYSEYEMTIDLGNKTYNIEGHDTTSKIWQVGAANNWGNPAAGLSMNNDGTYTGYMFLNTYFMFREYEDSWDGTFWGGGNYNDNYSYGYLVANGSNLYTPQGFYKVDVNLNELYYTLTAISSVNIIGPAVQGTTAWETDKDLTYNQNTGAWEISCVLNKGDFKIRANHDWNLNWGGTLDNLVFWGNNLTIAQPGPYKVEVFLTYDGNSHATVTRL